MELAFSVSVSVIGILREQRQDISAKPIALSGQRALLYLVSGSFISRSPESAVQRSRSIRSFLPRSFFF